ncbi:hypothetical protein CLOSTASPAR_03911 [[Clostridium] asparagiforme DSM 15981]|uniref:Uncharacterized protein n=1 Tax=[Clostridium] asparagiforme DSM 15981 TaxID=518636 RepID=C0D3S0_9FIRM|nr:hypothetical protein CLOSTASPAR_03911 [[Clostridium] asparagiforme DSM 15981]
MELFGQVKSAGFTFQNQSILQGINLSVLWKISEIESAFLAPGYFGAKTEK